ncbi:glycoside hydrolase [Winogradskyella echinorum]|uniref:Glycoside hydrolase n=1 Tax=Winogradskyella echinorum TaxID=538189 RepID=A0ABR6Y1C8_9FLAO|nr:glycosyl hydrolase [Winogradskyella echinorum]MBC3846552.1 glycoside hydrolase [Winogradskyella echinorum]MBC5750900.1 glycoside hydrolase [Winogradskyella echinorum]
MQKTILLACTLLFLFVESCSEKQNNISIENETEISSKSQTKTWTRWWWMGSAVDSVNIKSNLIDLHKVGIGGVEIAPIYGVKGEEENYIDYLTPKWMNMLSYTTKIADSLGMEVDLTLGTGWPYGGPQVTQEFAATKLITQKYSVSKGDTFNKTIAVDNPKDKSTAVLNCVLVYGENGTYKDITTLVNNNTINWEAKDDNYTIFAVFTGKTRQQVKRAAPGAKGLTLDHYSKDALNTYLETFNTAFKDFDGNIRSIFNDSYEVYGTDFTPDFFNAFIKYRGYDLKPHLPLLLSEKETEESNRVKSDYRETLSDLLLYDFDEPWTQWANDNNYKSRLQAHGSPGNLIDLYASADIPECETFGSMPYDIEGFRREKEDIREGDADPVMLKFSSSAAHIAGKPLVSSETFTWLRDHFKVALSQTKPELEDLFLNGINHIFLHGTTYSPKRAEWPGWKFYASVNFNPNLAIGEDEKSLFDYIENCQNLLQSGDADNDILLYWPIYDVWNSHLDASLFFQFKIHSLDEWLHNQPFYNTTKELMDKGYGLDFISDNFIKKADVVDGQLKLPGGLYKTLVVPTSTNMPLNTLKKLIELKKKGAKIVFQDLPQSVPGFKDYEAQNKVLQKIISENKEIIFPAKDIFSDINNAKALPETLVETGLKFIRRDHNGNKIYYLVNHTSDVIDEFIPVNVKSEQVTIYNPDTDTYGNAQIKAEGDKTLVRVQIKSGESLFVTTDATNTYEDWAYFQSTNKTYNLNGDWKIDFLRGGPSLPNSASISELTSWTNLSKDAEYFSGTAKYEMTFENPDKNTKNWLLKLGDVRESAKIWLNDEFVGTLWVNPFDVNLELKQGKNKLTIEVTNLSANRIRAKELRGEEWKIFHEINMVNKDYEKFDATKWNPMPSGLLGPVTLIPLVKN